MVSTLLAIIGMLLIFIGWQQRQHELWAERLTQPPRLPRLSPPPMPPPRPRPLTRRELLAPLAELEERHMPFLLERPAREPAFWEVAPTREWRRFEAYGVDISIHPTICVD